MNTRTLFVKIAICFAILFSFSCQSDNNVKESDKTFFKGFMLDVARTVENMEHYYRVVDFCAENGFNTIHFRVTDDQGCAMQFKSRPDLIHHVGAFSADELKEFVKYADEKGIEIIPEVETFGHTKFITQIDKYNYLEDILDPSIEWANGICPVHDTTLAIMKDLITEVVDIFPSKYLHIGCDETNWGGNELTKKALEEKPKIEIWAEYVNKLNAFVKENGKTSIIWADVPLREEHEILDLLDKDIVLMDWNYWETNEDSIRANAEQMLNGGYKIIGAPAINWMMWGARIGGFQLENMQAFCNVYNSIDDENNLGVIYTHWCPWRYTQNAMWDTYTLAGEILNNPSYDMMATLKKFTESHYGATWDEDWEKIYTDVYKYTPKNKYHGEDLGVEEFHTWREKGDLEYIFAKEDSFKNHFVGIFSLLKKQEASITKNKSDFQEFLLSVEYMNHMVWRENLLFDIKEDESSMPEILVEIAEADKVMLAKLDAIWKQGRKGEMSEMHIWDFPKAATYSAKLAEDNSELEEVLNGLE